MNMLLLDERPQVDPGWIDSNISAIVEDFLKAQVDPGTKTRAQLDPGFKTRAPRSRCATGSGGTP